MSVLRFVLLSALLLSTTLWASVGKVALLKGEAFLERGTQKIALQNGSILEEKDTIRTSKEAQIQIIFEDKTVITLGGESTLSIEEYLNDANKPKAKFKFNQGTFKTITGQIGKTAPENFKMETKTATIGIRGTIAAGSIPPPPPPATPPLPESFFCLGGTITIAPLQNPGAMVIVPTGSFTQVLTPSAPPAPPAAFSPADLQQLNQGGLGAMLPPPAPPPPPSGSTPPAVSQAQQTNLQQTTLQELGDRIASISCPAGSVGTAPNCQTINTAYALPDYWTANLLASSTAEQKTLQGYATGGFDSDGVSHEMGTFSLTIDGGITAVDVTSGTISFPIAEYSVNLTKNPNSSSEMTYSSLNKFSLKDFYLSTDSWLQTEETVINQYVSWGYWQYNYSTILPILNFWVAGIDTLGAKTHILVLEGQGTPTTYTYTGKSIGYVYNSDLNTYTGIDAVNNNTVFLKFDFGSGTPLNTSSYIQFQTNGTTPEVWKFDGFSGSLGVSGDSKTFSALGAVSVNNGQPNLEAGTIQGTFYGNQAQAVGGSFKGSISTQDTTKTAIGVFKAVR